MDRWRRFWGPRISRPLSAVIQLSLSARGTDEPYDPVTDQKAKPSARSSATSKGTTCAKSTPHSSQQNHVKFLLVGDRSINDVVEAFFKTIKAELAWRRTWETRHQAETTIFQYISGFYNLRRRHSALGGKSPLAFERKAAHTSNRIGINT